MTKQQHERHREQHKAWHRALDQLAADWALHHMRKPGKGVGAKDLKVFSNSTIMELLEWSAKQTQDPDELEE